MMQDLEVMIIPVIAMGMTSKVMATETDQGLKSISIGMERRFPFSTQIKPTGMETDPSLDLSSRHDIST